MKPHTPEFHEAYRSATLMPIAEHIGHAGQFPLEAMDEAPALLIAMRYWDVEYLRRIEDGTWAVCTRGGWSAVVGFYEGAPAILHKLPDGSRRLDVLALFTLVSNHFLVLV